MKLVVVRENFHGEVNPFYHSYGLNGSGTLEWLGCFLLFLLVNLCSSFCVKSQWKCHFVDYSGPLYV